ncbi:hypothetical protein K438DRAFT_1759172 [Mycena galopus ATCC 62051]|nr:hypothetical protein K438DRAFT_1759172 [Mycena galopus ATCC 62051]
MEGEVPDVSKAEGDARRGVPLTILTALNMIDAPMGIEGVVITLIPFFTPSLDMDTAWMCGPNKDNSAVGEEFVLELVHCGIEEVETKVDEFLAKEFTKRATNMHQQIPSPHAHSTHRCASNAASSAPIPFLPTHHSSVREVSEEQCEASKASEVAHLFWLQALDLCVKFSLTHFISELTSIMHRMPILLSEFNLSVDQKFALPISCVVVNCVTVPAYYFELQPTTGSTPKLQPNYKHYVHQNYTPTT